MILHAVSESLNWLPTHKWISSNKRPENLIARLLTTEMRENRKL